MSPVGRFEPVRSTRFGGPVTAISASRFLILILPRKNAAYFAFFTGTTPRSMLFQACSSTASVAGA